MPLVRDDVLWLRPPDVTVIGFPLDRRGLGVVRKSPTTGPVSTSDWLASIPGDEAFASTPPESSCWVGACAAPGLAPLPQDTASPRSGPMANMRVVHRTARPGQ